MASISEISPANISVLRNVVQDRASQEDETGGDQAVNFQQETDEANGPGGVRAQGDDTGDGQTGAGQPGTGQNGEGGQPPVTGGPAGSNLAAGSLGTLIQATQEQPTQQQQDAEDTAAAEQENDDLASAANVPSGSPTSSLTPGGQNTNQNIFTFA